MKRTPLKPVSAKTAKRNSRWRQICLAKADYLINKYGHIICEYSSESVRTLSSTGNDLNDAWGHHIDGNRNNCTIENCYIVKYKYHRYIHDHNLKVRQEGFEGNNGKYH